MTGNIRVLIVAVLLIVAVAAAVGLYLWQGDSEPPPLPERQVVTVPDAIPVEEVAVQSSELAVELVAMRGNVHPDYTDWSCILECREREGCRADVQVDVEYRSSGEARKLTIGGRLFGEPGEIMRIGRVQRPPVSVDSIDKVTITVLQVFSADNPNERIIID